MRMPARLALFVSMVLLVGCAPSSPAGAASPALRDAGGTATVQAPSAAAGSHACMIAGSFEIMGKSIRSRDCLQADASVPRAQHTTFCEQLAQTSKQLGGKAGELTYMATCPTPAQGSCKGIFGGAMHAYYYERDADDLATLPDSCRMGGGHWVPAA